MDLKIDDGSELKDVIQDMKRHRKLLLFSRGKDWWLALPPRRVSFDGSKLSHMQVISSSIPRLPSDTGTDYFELTYEHFDSDLEIKRKGSILVSLEEPGHLTDLPERCELKTQRFIHEIEGKGILRLSAVDREDLPLYMMNPRSLCELILKEI